MDFFSEEDDVWCSKDDSLPAELPLPTEAADSYRTYTHIQVTNVKSVHGNFL